MSPGFGDLNPERSEPYRKNPEDEDFLSRMNRALLPLERSLYRKDEPDHPFVFVIGLPRSGTTLLSQLLAHCLRLGYVDNVAARFWLAPVCGVRLSRAILDHEEYAGYQSEYGATSGPRDIHEFGYFWMHWLQKHTFEDVRDHAELEEEIDWTGLRRVLANLQAEFGSGLVAKNIYGSYHIPRLTRTLGDVLWLWIRRDELDVAVSILDARRRYFDDTSNWWSYVPPAYEKVIDAEPAMQIAGQIHYLERFYESQAGRPDLEQNVLQVGYDELCVDPRALLERVQAALRDRFGYEVDLVREPPSGFRFSRYDDRDEDKARFLERLESLRRGEPA